MNEAAHQHLLRLKDIVAKENDGEKLMHKVAESHRSESIEVLRYLVHSGENVNVIDKEGETPLHKAAKSLKGSIDVDIVDFLIQSGADVNSKSNSGRTPLYYAIRWKRTPEIAKLLIKHGADVNDAGINTGDVFWKMPLHSALSLGNSDFVEMLLLNGADANAKDRGNTPLHFFLSQRFCPPQDMVSLLIRHGADVNAKDENGNTPLHCAVNLTDFIFDEADEATSATTILSEFEEDVDDKNEEEQCYSLFFDPHKESAKIAKIASFLIQSGANVNAKNENGNTPLHCVVSKSKYPNVAETLICNGANVNEKNIDGATPLHYAVKSDKTRNVADLLIRNGAYVNAKDNDGLTPLHYTVICHCSDLTLNGKCVTMLLKHGADVSIKNSMGRTASSIAEDSGLTLKDIEDGRPSFSTI